MRRGIRTLLLTFLLMFVFASVSVCAAQEDAGGQTVYDDAGLLTQGERDDLTEQIASFTDGMSLR